MQHSRDHSPNGNRPITIEVNGEPMGVVVPEADGFRFLAVRLTAFAIEGQLFDSIDAAREAAGVALSRTV